jgi:hypothetical protein
MYTNVYTNPYRCSDVIKHVPIRTLSHTYRFLEFFLLIWNKVVNCGKMCRLKGARIDNAKYKAL